MYFIHYFYVSVTAAAPKCPRAESPASSWTCAELSRRRVGGAELAAPNRRRRVVPFRFLSDNLAHANHFTSASPCPTHISSSSADLLLFSRSLFDSRLNTHFFTNPFHLSQDWLHACTDSYCWCFSLSTSAFTIHFKSTISVFLFLCARTHWPTVVFWAHANKSFHIQARRQGVRTHPQISKM